MDSAMYRSEAIYLRKRMFLNICQNKEKKRKEEKGAAWGESLVAEVHTEFANQMALKGARSPMGTVLLNENNLQVSVYI